MAETRIKISSVVENQLPQFVREEFPLVSEFLTQYYTSQESQGGASDILQNIDQYIKVDNLTNLIESTELSSDVTFFDSTINVLSTAGFPDSYGLLLVDSEIITYTSKTSTTFEGCIRGFSGVTSYKEKNDELTFTSTEAVDHSVIVNNIPTKVINLSIVFLKEFLIKVKKQVTPGFENRQLYSELNERVFIKQAIDFYSSKGTDNSFKILFGALYGSNVEVIKPRDYLIQASDAQYRITSDLVVEEIEGNPEDLINLTLYQDKTDFINQAQGTITKVEKIKRGLKDYYIISLDYDYNKDILPVGTVYGNFSIHPKTNLVFSASSGSTTLEVDSTVGFPEKNGNLMVDLENGTSLQIVYKSKTLNQFLDCSGINQDIPESTEIKSDYFAYGRTSSGIVKIRILGVLSDLEIPQNTKLFSKNDLIKIKTLGIDLKDQKSNNWFFNVPVEYQVSSILEVDIPSDSNNPSNSYKLYRVNTYDNHSFRIGDSVTFISSSEDDKTATVSSFNNNKSFTVKLGSGEQSLNLNLTYKVKKNLSKVTSENYPAVNKYTANVQNVYYEDKNSIYVSSPSLPKYEIKATDRSLLFSGTFSGETLNLNKDHHFYTGDSIVYKPSSDNNLGISTGIYFVKKISDREIKLARSKDNIFTNNFVSVNGTVVDAKFELTEFTYKNLDTQLLESQKLIRKISTPDNDSNKYETNFGSIGIFINGVELLNYKSKDNVYYGPIEKIIPTSPGFGYDIINPPTLLTIDPIGSGANSYCSVVGGLDRIEIIDQGFDYLEEPKIEISGGNGSGASAKAKLVSFDHEVSFNSIGSAELVKLNPTNTIGFSSYHKFRDIEEVIYITNEQTAVGGLSTNSSYFVSVQDAHTVKLYASANDAIVGINTIRLTSYGSGNHIFKSKNKKRKIGSIVIENSGVNYQNKLTTTTAVGINTASNIISIHDHGYETGEIITYNATETPVGGLSSATSYYVTKIDNSQFRLSQIGVSTLGITTSFFFDTKQYVNLITGGSGTHKFNYPEIKVSVKGKIGVSTLSGQDYNAKIQPIFRGNIQSVFVESGGSGYGSEDILNHNRQPLFELISGSGIQLKPIVSEGKIVDVIINSSGNNYNSPPNIVVNGSGVGAILTPVISNGSLIDIKIISGGIGYDPQNTSIDVISAGNGAKFEAKIKSWKINLVQRLLQNSQIREDDGILTPGLNSDYGLQYAHAYAPRPLRSLVQGTSYRDGKETYSLDLEFLNNTEINSIGHSPIIGWAYDGNPIYGPYGYSSSTGGSVRLLKPGYKEVLKLNRPSTSIYPLGFFVEDYEYVGDGDLDEHNGRFSVTPEYPNGVYAYFTTVGNNSNVFNNYKEPIFPYVIGNTYKSKPIDFNFQAKSNQDYININQTNWRRNTTPYNILNQNSSYEYILNPNNIKQQNSIVKTILTGSIESIGIVTGGINYKIGDKLVFNHKSGYGAKASVSLIGGKQVTQISVATSSFDDIEFYPYEQEFIGFATIPHNYLNNDLVTITGKYDYKKSGNIKLTNNILALTAGVGSANYTGLVTYFNVAGNLLYPNIKENDIYQIGNEQIKILNIDLQSSRIKVLRNQNNTIGLTSYSAGIALTENTRKFRVNFGISTSYNFDVNKEFYFDPKESVGLGTISGVGIGSTLYFSNPGAGITQITIPTQSIYIKDHKLNTGDSLIYSSNGGTQVSVSTNGSSTFVLDEQSIVYVARLSNDLIGISTVKVGLSSTGIFVSTGSTPGSLLYFNSFGSGSTHSFKTNYTNTFTGQISKNVITVSTAETHGLSLFDNVILDINSGITTTFVIKYNDYNRRLVINPRNFSSIDVENNTINIDKHGYYTGQKVLYTSNNPASGLTNNELYYVVVIDSNNIRLSNSYYQATKTNPETIDILSSSAGTISPINPPLKVLRNQTVIFDLSDSSLSFIGAGITYSAFDLKLYKDSSFKQEFNSSESSQFFEVTKSGSIGIDSTAKITLNVTDDLPVNLFYNLVPVRLDINSQVKKEIISDIDVLGSNKITIEKSVYAGNHTIVGISSTSFIYNILEYPETSSYQNNVDYFTNSRTAKGEIKEIVIANGGKYKELPGISSVSSEYGSGSILIPQSNSIGKITSTEIEDIGFDYSSDFSVRPTAKLPDILILETLSTIDYIGITSVGTNYNVAPTPIVIDGLTNKIIDNVILKYSLGDPRVTILKNSNTISNVVPKIIPTNNSNGYKIKNITFNNNTKNVTVTLGSVFNDPEDYPFEIGSKVLIEGVSVGTATTGKGYNSSDYEYTLFAITAIDPNIGGADGTITYNLSSHLKSGEFPGTFNSSLSVAKIIPESHFPIFNPVLKSNNFYAGEVLNSNTNTGDVISWDSDNRYLKVSTNKNFNVGELVVGKTSNSAGIIKEIVEFDSNYRINSFSPRRKGWNRETGFLNNNFQRVHDSDYYQYFSYDLKSQVDLSSWEDAVSSLNHTVGFKKFGNLIVESKPEISGMSTDQNDGDFTGISDLSRVVNLNCTSDFDLVTENSILLNGILSSNEIIFNSRIIQDYIESIGNRVLVIDDISDRFNSNPRSTQYSIVDSFLLSDFRSKKYIISVQDKSIANRIQLSSVSLIYNNNVGFINQYGEKTFEDLGFFDFSISGNNGNLLFYPVKTKYNDYYVNLFSFSLNDITSGIGTVNLGDSVNIRTNTTTIPTGTNTSTTIVGIASTYRSSKVLVQIGATDSSYYQYNEITYIHDGNNVHLLEYGDITTDLLNSRYSSGIGTFNAYLSGSDILIDIIPDNVTTKEYVVNVMNISLSDYNYTGIGTENIGPSSIKSYSTSIGSSTSPTSNIIASHSNLNYSTSYFIISIEDTTNSQYQISELLAITNSNESYITEYGVIETGSILGITTAGVSGSDTNLYFTPIENIDVEVKVFGVHLPFGVNPESSLIPLINGSLNFDYGDYVGTHNDVRKSFNLTHKNLPIFQRYFDGSSSSVVNIDSNTIRIPRHFYVTGEEIVYSYPGYGTTQAIGIATTSIPGIGTTDKLPSSLYVVKVSDLDIRVAASASDALKSIPNVLDLTSVGIGTSHVFTSKNQNKKGIIAIDNLIQSPVVSTSTTSSLLVDVGFSDSEIYLSNLSLIYGGDLIKIDNEIMKVISVGVGSTNSLFVRRPWLGTGLSTHSSSSLVTKVIGNYNIVDNIIHFTEAPHGKVPMLNPTNRPDEIDYIGIVTSSSFSGRIFLRSGESDTSQESYTNNYIFDDVSKDFNGTQKSFTLKSNRTNITGISTDNAIILINDIFQGPTVDYNLTENAGITSVTFTGFALSTSYDVNTASIPRGGVILSIGSTQGFGYQPLVSAGGTAIVSVAGTIQSISIGNSGSGYRSGIQNIVNVGVKTDTSETSTIHFIGTATVSNGNIVGVAITNPGTGYTSSNPPIVIFDSPLSYSNIPLVYSSQSPSGVGTGAVVDVVVGQGSSVISFELKNLGYGYKQNEILTISYGGATGIPTNTSSSFSEFQIVIDKTYEDKFTGWTIGSLQVIDPLDELFDGDRKRFPIRINGNQTTIRSKKGSIIDQQALEASLLIFINDVLQVPGKAYTFKGGSIIRFTEAPKEGDRSRILFYRGTGGIDTLDVDILETVKVGDNVTINSDNINLSQDERLVTEIVSSDTLNTNLYPGPGVTNDDTLLRPIIWCRQTEDLVVDGQKIGKDRVLYEPYVQPTTNLIQNVGIGSTVIFVESVKAFFDSQREYLHNGTNEKPQNKILIISQDSVVSASATATVSSAGTITSININESGVGYSTSPTISISNPIGVGVSGVAMASASISGGSVSSVAITTGGFGYDPSNPPVVLIEPPTTKYEVIDRVSYQGDFGVITGVSTTSVGVAYTGIVFDFFIPTDSIIRDPKIVKVGIATTGISGIQTGYYFTVRNSNVGKGLTSLNSSGSIIGVGTTFIDNIYQVASVSIAQTAVPGIGITNVAKVTVSVSDYNNLTGLGFSNFYGEYSWGRILTPVRLNPREFESYANVGGISTSPIIQRFSRLKYIGYSTT